MKKIYIIIGILFAILILFISIARANLEVVLKEEREDRIRVIPMNIVINKENGEKIKSVYYLPKIKIYPTNILYPVKIWRDQLWLALTRNPCEKSKLLLLIADKKMSEDDSLSANEAVDYLIESWKSCPDNRTQTNNAIEAYRQITRKMRKYLTANEKIEEFIKSEKIFTQN